MNTWKLNNSNSRREQANTRELTMQCMICDKLEQISKKFSNVFIYTIFPKEVERGGVNNLILQMKKLSF